MTRALLSWLASLTLEAVAAGRTILASKAVRTAMLFLWPWAGVIVGMDMAAHYGDATGAALPVELFISQDHSFGEYLEYALTASSAAMLFIMWLRLGAALMDWAIAEARGSGADALQLSVFSENFGAQRFYHRYGFGKVADIDFWVGNHRDHEFLYELKL